MATRRTDPTQHPLDELTRVLQGQAAALRQVEQQTEALSTEAQHQSDRLDRLLEQASSIANAVGIELPQGPQPAHPIELEHVPQEMSWQALLHKYSLDRAEISLDALLPPEVVAAIDARFDAPLARLPWDRWDHTVVFAAALVGILSDWFCAPLGNPLSNKLLTYGATLHDRQGVDRMFGHLQRRLGDSAIATRFAWVRELAEMDVSHHNLPIDFSGPDFGGPHHRALSPGHDLLRFMSAIWQIKHGQFIGTHFEHNVPIMVIRTVSQRGVPYSPDADWFSAVVAYLLHLLADFFTHTSLPLPGTSFLRESSHREVRTFVLDMYKGIDPQYPSAGGRPDPHGGYNLRHVVGQSVTTGVTQIIVWLYHLLRYRLPEWVARRRGRPIPSEPVPGLKLNELLAVAHTTVAAVNVGKVVVLRNPFLLNLPQLLMCMKTLGAVGLSNLHRYDLGAPSLRSGGAIWAQPPVSRPGVGADRGYGAAARGRRSLPTP